MDASYPNWKRVLWILVGGFTVFVAGKSIVPDLLAAARDKVAIVRVEGPILDAQGTIDELTTYAEDPTVRAIVMRIDSPGGGVAPSQEIYNAVKRVRREKNKTVVASMGTVAASGGYYIAVASDRILANPGTLTGSIGVIMQMTNFQEILEKVGVKNVVIKSGKFKDIGSPFRPMRDEDRAILQSVMDDVHRQFIEAVADGRSLDSSEVELLADGRIFTGKQAKSILLVDDIGDLHDAVRLAGDLGGIKGEPMVIETTKPFSFRDFLETKFLGDTRAFSFPKLGNLFMYLWIV